MNINTITLNIGDSLKTIRKNKNLSQAQLAKISGISRSLISHYEINSKTPSVEKLVKLAYALNVAVDILLGIEKFKPVKNDISLRVMNKARLIEKLPTREQNEVIKLIDDKAGKAGVE